MKITKAELEVLRSLKSSLQRTLAKARKEFGADSESYALVLEQFSPIGVPSGRSLYPIINFRDAANKETYDSLVRDYNAFAAPGCPDLDETVGMMLAEGLVVAFTDKKIYGITSSGLTALRDVTLVESYG